MNRRKFFGLSVSASAVALLGGNKVFAVNHMQNGHGMAGHDMQGMNAGMGGMMAGTDLLPVDALPGGAPLATLALLKNQSGKDGLFKAQLTAKETPIELVKGKPTTFMTYNDQIPGPQIVVTEGDTVEIEFKNSLKEPTTIHWHGLPVPPEQDGNPHDPVLPGQTHTYRFTLPEGSAGTYWYHTHAHELAAAQAYRGLAGSFIVKAKNDPLAHLPEQHWLISDLRLDNEGQIPGNDMFDWMNGREGQFALLNGQRQPAITIQGTQRVRIWNACNARYLNLSIPNCEFIVVGTDGGLLEKPASAVRELLIVPGERYEVVIRAIQSGTFPLNSLPFNRQKMMVDFKPETLVLANVSIKAVEPDLPGKLRTIADFGPATAQKKVTFGERPMDHAAGMTTGHEMSDMPPSTMSDLFFINDKTFDMNRIDLSSKVGEVEEWILYNNSHMDHPFHIHGTQFLVTEHVIDGKASQPVYRALKDTVNLRPYETVHIKTVQTDKGIRMFHCHILEHESLGMMGQVEVV